jgi:hypothetical protein
MLAKSLALALIVAAILARPCLAQQDPLVDCLKGLAADTRFTPIAAKLAINAATDTTFPMLADQTIANGAEQKAISDWATARAECVKGGEAHWQQHYPPQLHALAIEAENMMMALAVDLYNKKITFGEFNKRRQVAADEVRNKIVAMVQHLQSEKQAREKAEREARQRSQWQAQQQAQQAQLAREQMEAQDDIARRQAAMGILLGRMGATPAYAPMRPYQMPTRPSVNTNCSQTGNQLNCTTR